MNDNPYQPPSSALTERGIFDEQVSRVAVVQRRVILIILAYIGTGLMIPLLKVLVPGIPENLLVIPGGLILLSMGIYHFINIYKLADALGLNAIAWLVGMFIPYVNLVVLFLLINKATKFLKEAGIEVGLLGAKVKDL